MSQQDEWTAAPDMSTEDRIAGTVMAGVVWLLMQDPQVQAMAAENDEQRFVEGWNNSPACQQRFGMALLRVREAALTA